MFRKIFNSVITPNTALAKCFTLKLFYMVSFPVCRNFYYDFLFVSLDVKQVPVAITVKRKEALIPCLTDLKV